MISILAKAKMKSLSLLGIFTCLLASILPILSITTPHRLYPFETPLARASVSARALQERLHDTSGPNHLLTINDGYSVDLGLNEHSSIALNLNQGVDQDIDVLVSIYSGPDLIEFDTNNNRSKLVRSDTSSSKLTTSVVVAYKADEFGDKIVKFHTRTQAGHAEIVCIVQNQPLKNNITIDDSGAYISINIHREWNLTVLIYVVGWIYFFAWSASFYFQIILNFKRKSVVGLSFDFIALNLLGFTCYSIYNAALLFSRPVQSVYYRRYAYTRIPVEYNDLFFSVHAFLVSFITLVQCFIYERGEQKVSTPAGVFIGISSVLGVGLYIASLFQSVTILDVVLYLSYVKLIIVAIKYTPQAFMNYQRKATTGWSIHNILLDFTGGTFSLAQLLLIAYNYNDWISIFGNFTKFGLAALSISFDILFMIQHYVLYDRADGIEDAAERLNPVISESIRSANLVPQQLQPPTPGIRNKARFAPQPPASDASRQVVQQRQQNEGFDNENFVDSE